VVADLPARARQQRLSMLSRSSKQSMSKIHFVKQSS
jgi:hypothetical protein